MAQFDAADDRYIDKANEFVLECAPQPTLRLAETIHATTDTRRPAKLMEPVETRLLEPIVANELKILTEGKYLERVIRLGPVSDSSNCHGWVFTGGRYWLSHEDVEHILVDNGYLPVSNPRPGDIAIYRTAGTIMHTALVHSAAEGKPVLVESKWGCMGVFLHGVNDCCCGKNYTYFRSSRSGHVLAGLSGSPDRLLTEHGLDTILAEDQ
jgi:hypothetical protein